MTMMSIEYLGSLKETLNKYSKLRMNNSNDVVREYIFDMLHDMSTEVTQVIQDKQYM